MLSEDHLQLLTAFVDGELTRRQRKAVLRLLNGSSEARAILQDLQENAHKLRELPHRKLGTGFAGQVLQAIAARGLEPAAAVPQPRTRRRLPGWGKVAVAAAVVLAAGMGFYFANRGAQPVDSDLVAIRRHADEPELLPAPYRDVPLQMTFKDLAQQPQRELLARQIQKETAVHLDVTVRNNAKAVERLQNVLGKQGIKTIVDARTRANLKAAGQGRTEVVVYAENVRAEELELILRQLADEPPGKAAPKATFESMVVTAMSTDDRQKLSGLFGVDAAEFETPKRHGDAKLFENMIIEAPKDKQKKAAPVSAPRMERFAMVMARNAGAGSASAEVRLFLAGRQQQRPGTVQVMLVIHQA